MALSSGKRERSGGAKCSNKLQRREAPYAGPPLDERTFPIRFEGSLSAAPRRGTPASWCALHHSQTVGQSMQAENDLLFAHGFE